MALSPLGIALMQAQTQQPTAHPGQIGPTDTLGAYQLSGNMAEQQYQAQLAQQNALWGGLAGLGAAGIVGASKIPAVQTAVGNWLSPGSSAASGDAAADAAADAATAGNPAAWGLASAAAPAAGNSVADLSSGAAGLGSWMSDPALASLGQASALPYAAGSTVAGDLAAAAPAAAAGTDAAAAGGIGSLADLLPFLFA
jgi:hypothetical protein